MTMKNHQYSQFFWHMSVSGVFLVHVTVPTLTPLNLLLKSARTAHPVLNAFSTVFILTSTVISIHSSIWLEGGWWMTCVTHLGWHSATERSKIRQRTWYYDTCCIYHVTPSAYVGVHTIHNYTLKCVHHHCCRRSLHAIWSNTSVHTQKNVQFEATHTMSFCLEMVTHKPWFCFSCTHRKSLCLSVTHRKLLTFLTSRLPTASLECYRITRRKMYLL